METYRNFLLTPSPILSKLYQSKRRNTSPMVAISSTNDSTVTAIDSNVVEEPVENAGFKIIQDTALGNICK